MRRARSHKNPITFDNRVEVTPELRESIRSAKDRSTASILSPIKQRAIEQATANSPHNFRILLGGPEEAQRVPNVVTLYRDRLTLVGTKDEAESRAGRESIYTAFTYLHRFGDEVSDLLPVADTKNLPYFDALQNDVLPAFAKGLGRSVYDLSEDPALYNRLRKVARELNACRRIFADAESMLSDAPEDTLEVYIATHINSKMVRERYALSHWEALSDLFPLCELTPASRPLFLPFDPSRFLAEYPGHARHRFSTQEARALDTYGKKMNVRFRVFYNALFPALYGSAWGI